MIPKKVCFYSDHLWFLNFGNCKSIQIQRMKRDIISLAADKILKNVY